MKKVDTDRAYGSDAMVDMLQALGLRYVSLNPGATFRGLHDSFVNYGGNQPELIECQHEKVAVSLAHGYAKASGEPMAVIVHDIVGLLQASMGIFYAFHDRVPVIVLGGAGPMDAAERRPNIDWYHTANIQGTAVREYTKWDDQPASLQALSGSLARAWRIATTGPQGPVYLALDAGLQESALDPATVLSLPDPRRIPTGVGADPDGLQRLADALLHAERPVMIAGYPGRDPAAFRQLVELAELLGMAVVDTHARLNFPSRHPLNATGSAIVEEADLVFFVDMKDVEEPITQVDSVSRTRTSRLSPGTTIVSLGFHEIGISAWSHDLGAPVEADLEVMADTSVALPQLLDLVRDLEAGRPQDRERRERRREAVAEVHAATVARWEQEARETWDASPVATARLAAEVYEVIKDYDWVLTAGTANGWASRIWDFDAPHRHPGKSLGTATQIGIALGVALAHRGKDRLVVDLQPDGDLMFDVGALWTAAYHQIPLLVVMFNNRAYYNDWKHQEVIALDRGRPVENAYLGMEIDGPAPDFAMVARALGWHGEGPITDPDQVQGAVRRAAEIVMSTGQPVLVDVVCQMR